MAALTIHWGQDRIEDDAEMYQALEAWRLQDRHLWEWESSQRKRAIRQRREQFRRLAAQLARGYQHVCLEDTDWRNMARTPEVDQDPASAARGYRFLAAPGELGEILRHAFGGGIKVPAEWTTQRCSECGKMDAFDAASIRIRCCRHCNQVLDQDRRAARNILSVGQEILASGKVMSNPPGGSREAQDPGDNGDVDDGSGEARPKGRFQRRALARRKKNAGGNTSSDADCGETCQGV